MIPYTAIGNFGDLDFDVFPIQRTSSSYLPLRDGENFIARKIIVISNLVNQK